MSDALLALGWVVVLAAGIGGCVWLHHRGLASTHARDLLHIGTGIWVLGWPYWQTRIVPTVLVTAACAATLLVPRAARTNRALAKLEKTFASGDELWTGLSLYTIVYAVLTWIGLSGRPFEAAAGLLALSLGDGIGGAVGRRFGRHRFRLPGAKTKSIEGSLAVAAGAAVAVGLAAFRFDVAISGPRVAGLAVVAAAAEALSPRSADNLIVPAAVFGAAEALT